MKKVLFLLAATSVVASASPQVDQFCQTVNPRAIQRMASMPQGEYAAWWPEFFEDKSSGSSKYYAAVMCSASINSIVNGGNCIVDLATGQVTKAPGYYDGQWVKDPADESIFTIPNKFSVAKGEAQPGLTFFRHRDVIQNGAQAPAIYRDPGFGNHYHSFGLVARGSDASGKYAINRVMNDKWGVSIKDYRFNLDNSGQVLSIQPLGSEINLTNGPGDTEVMKSVPAAIADQNPHQSYYDLPMISRDGRFFAANNRKTMTTQIFEIVNGSKRLVADLGFETGKVSFAPRKSNSGDLYIAFHIDQIDPAEGDKMTGVHFGMTKDIVVMRLTEKRDATGQLVFEPGKMVRVTLSRQTGDGNYYPKWVNEKELIYIESRNNNQQTFVKVNADLLDFKNNIVPRPMALLTPAQYAASSALGYYVAAVCTNFPTQISAKEASLYTMNLTKSSCRSVAKTWDTWKGTAQWSTEFFNLRPAKSPGQQRYSGWNFHESSSSRGSQRFEQVVQQSVLTGLRASDLTAVCDLL